MLSWSDWRFLYLDQKGRITRQAFWLGCLPLMLVVGAISWPVSMLNLLLGQPQMLPSVVLAILYLVLAWPAWCLSAKRRHDRGASGLDVVVFVAVAVAGFAFSRIVLADDWELRKQWWALLPTFVTSTYFFAILIPLGVLPGKPGSNKYGPDPAAKQPST